MEMSLKEDLRCGSCLNRNDGRDLNWRCAGLDNSSESGVVKGNNLTPVYAIG